MVVAVVLLLVLLGIVLNMVPMEPRIKTLAVVVICVVVLAWLLLALGLLPVGDIGVPRIR